MENSNYTQISVDDYRKIEAGIDSMCSEKNLIETHKKLVGKSCKNDYYHIKDCGTEFIKKFLSRDWGRSIVYRYSQGAENFIHSKYLSDYFKSNIKELLIDEDLSDEVVNAIDSDKLINDMSEEELNAIYSAIKEFYNKQMRSEKVNVANHFMSLLYKLDGKGVVSFIKNNVTNSDLASHILLTSGLSDRASYYSGRGVNYGDLNEKNLVAIFEKLLKLDVCYAAEFAEMVCQMKTLGATEFINSFVNFAANGFKANTLIEESNISLDGVYEKTRDTVAFISIVSAMSRGNDMESQINDSEEMKHSFISTIRPVLEEVNLQIPGGKKTYHSYGYGKNYGHRHRIR